jgi:hypothetical protein
MKKRTLIGHVGSISRNSEAKFGGAAEKLERINKGVSFKNMSVRKMKMKTKETAIKRSKNKNLINLYDVFVAKKSATILMIATGILISKLGKTILNKSLSELISLKTFENCLQILRL